MAFATRTSPDLYSSLTVHGEINWILARTHMLDLVGPDIEHCSKSNPTYDEVYIEAVGFLAYAAYSHRANAHAVGEVAKLHGQTLHLGTLGFVLQLVL